MLTVIQERSPLIEIDGGSEIKAVMFTVNGEYIVGGGDDGLRVWRAKDGKRMATMAARDVNCLAVSKDGRWIASGTYEGELFMWDAKTFKNVLTHQEDDDDLFGVDFSPDSTRLLIGSESCTATVWDVATRKKLLSLDHEDWVIAAKYSPQGNRIATATRESVRVWDSNDGRLLVDIPVKVTPYWHSGLLWFNNHLFVVSNSTIKQFEASTGSTVSEWSVPDTNNSSYITLPQHLEFIAYSTNDTVTFWDTSTHTRVGLIQHTQSIRSIALSPDNRFLVIGGNSGKIAITDLRDVPPASYSTVSIFYCQFTLLQFQFDLTDHFVSQLPFIEITNAALDSWKQDWLADVETSLTGTITNSRNQSHHALANRALVRARLQHWDLAIEDAENVSLRSLSHTLLLILNYHKSIKIHPSFNGYIAQSLALVGGGKKAEGCRVYDLAFRHYRYHTIDVDLILLIKVCILCAVELGFPSASYLT
jgi:WD40 repeat protein